MSAGAGRPGEDLPADPHQLEAVADRHVANQASFRGHDQCDLLDGGDHGRVADGASKPDGPQFGNAVGIADLGHFVGDPQWRRGGHEPAERRPQVVAADQLDQARSQDLANIAWVPVQKPGCCKVG